MMIPQELIKKGRYWTKAWSLIEGCTPVSEACDNCWLKSMHYRFKPDFPFGAVRIREDRLIIPLKTRKPQVFAVWSDLFHEAVPAEFIGKAYEVMLDDNKHTYLLLTKRPERLYQFYDAHRDALQFSGVIDDIWHGTTVENQEQADKRIPEFLKIPGKKVLSVEPMLGKINIMNYLFGSQRAGEPEQDDKIHQVICGGETGHYARPCHPDWIRSLRDQCAEAGVPFFFKGWGNYWKRKYRSVPQQLCIGRLLDGRTHDDLVWNTQ